MNSNIERLKSLPYVRRVVLSEGSLAALTDDSIGVHDNPPELSSRVEFHAPMSIVGGAECEVLWDSVAEDLKARLDGVPGFIGVKHRWCGEDEKIEVEVGRRRDDEEHRYSARETEERPVFPEGVYAIIVTPQREDERTAESRRKAARKDERSDDPVRAQIRAQGELARMREDYLKARKRGYAGDVNQYVAERRAQEEKEEEASYLVGATRAACVERVSRALEGVAESSAWGVEVLLDGEQDDRYKGIP